MAHDRLEQQQPLLPGPGGGREGLVFVVEAHGVLHEWTQRLWALLKLSAAAVLLSWLQSPSELPPPWGKLSGVVGWLYFLMWTVSFYPQLIANYRRKSVVGLSMDFTALNIAGFGCYLAFNVALMYSSRVKDEYQARFGNRAGPPVELNDLLFSLHALLLSVALAVQCCSYQRAPSQRVAGGTWLALAAAGAVGAAALARIQLLGEGGFPFTLLDVIYYCSLVKIGVSLVKYVPQVALNASRRSTEGWSVDNVLLDLGGGTLSCGQLLLSCFVLEDWSMVTGNPIKLCLGLISIAFDCLFILQHLVYAGAPATTPAYIDAAWQGQLSSGVRGCGTAGCSCPCPRCRFFVPANTSAAHYAAAAIALSPFADAPDAAGGPGGADGVTVPAARLGEFARSLVCMCAHGAASDNPFMPLASQFYSSRASVRASRVPGSPYRGWRSRRSSYSNLHSLLQDGQDWVI